MKTNTINTNSGPIHVAKHSTGAVAITDKETMTRNRFDLELFLLSRSRFTQELFRSDFPVRFEVSDDGHSWRAEAVRD